MCIRLIIIIQKQKNLVFGSDAAGEGHGAALYAGVSIAAVEVHVVGPVSVGHGAAAAELGSRRECTTRGERGQVRLLSLTCTPVCSGVFLK